MMSLDRIHAGSAEKMDAVPSSTVQLVVTSPPYNAVIIRNSLVPDGNQAISNKFATMSDRPREEEAEPAGNPVCRLDRRHSDHENSLSVLVR